MAVKPIIIPIQADTSGIQVGIDAIDALGGVDEATAKKFAQSNKAFADQNKIIAATSPEINRLIAAINGLTASIVGGAITQKLTQIGTASQAAGTMSAASAPKVDQLTDSLESLSNVEGVASVNSELQDTATVIDQVADSANVLHASFNAFTNDAEKVDFTKLSVEQLESALDGLIQKEGLLKSAQANTLDPELVAKYGEGLQSVTEDINTVSQLLDEANAAAFLDDEPVNKYEQAVRSLRAQLNGLNQDSPEFSQVTDELRASELAAAGFARQATSLRSQLRQYRETLATLEEAGLTGTQTFNDMAEAAGQLDDQLADTQARIRVLGSDTFAFDAAIQGAQGVAAAFSVAQGVSALLGSEDEQLQKTLLKVNAAMAILNGLQQVQNLLQAQSAVVIGVTVLQQRAAAAAVALQTAAENRNIIVRYAAILAQKALNAVMAANPVGLLIVAIAAFATALVALTSDTDDAAAATENLNKELKSQNDILDLNSSAYQRNAELLAAQAQQAGALGSALSIIRQDALRREAQDLVESIKINEDRLKNEKLNGDQRLALQKQIQEQRAKLDDINNKGQVQQIAISKQLQDEALKSATASAEALIAQTQKDSDARTQAEINAIRVRQQEALAAEGITNGEREKIIAESNEQIRQLNLDATKRRFDEQIALIQTKGLEEKNTFRKLEYEITALMLMSERDRLGKSKAQQQLIIAQTNEAVKALRKKLFDDLEKIESVHSTKTVGQQIKDFQDNVAREQALFNFKAQLRDQEAEAIKAKLLEEKAARQKLQDDSLQAASNIAGSLVQIAQNNADAQIAILDDQLNRGLISQQQYDQEVRKIKIRSAQQEKQLALFQATIAASLAVLAILRDQTIPIALRPLFIALAVAQAAAQIAAIQSKPIPAFAKGTKNAPGGDALVGEAGGELIYQNGSWSYAGQPTIMNLKKGAKVFPARETARIFEMYNVPKPYLQDHIAASGGGSVKIDYNKLGRVVGGEIAKMPVQLFGIDDKGFTNRTIRMADRSKFLKKRFGR